MEIRMVSPEIKVTWKKPETWKSVGFRKYLDLWLRNTEWRRTVGQRRCTFVWRWLSGRRFLVWNKIRSFLSLLSYSLPGAIDEIVERRQQELQVL